ncbi:GTP-binding protein ypt1, partial [Trichinella nelsoni]
LMSELIIFLTAVFEKFSSTQIDVRVSFSSQCSAVQCSAVVAGCSQLTMTTQARKQVYKLVLCGDYGVGKSSLFRRFVFDTFVESSDRKCTLGFDHFEKTYPIDDKCVTLQLWDTGGLERVATVTSSYFKFSNGVLLVFAYDDMDSLNDLSQHLVEALTCAEQARYFLCGNKADLYNEHNGYGPNEENVNLFCQQSSVGGLGGGSNLFSRVYKVSCKTNENVDEMFKDIARQLSAHGCHSAAPDPEMFRLKAVEPSSSYRRRCLFNQKFDHDDRRRPRRSGARCPSGQNLFGRVLLPYAFVNVRRPYGNWCRQTPTFAWQRPAMTFGGEFFVLLSGRSSNSSDGHLLFWSSDERFNRRDQRHARPSLVETCEMDLDGDGLVDEMQFNAAVPLHHSRLETVDSAKLWLVFNRMLRSGGQCQFDEDVLVMLDGGGSGTVGHRWTVSGSLRVSVVGSSPSSLSACEPRKSDQSPLGRLLSTSDKSPLDRTVSEIEGQLLFRVGTLVPSYGRWLETSDLGADQFRINVTVAYVEEPSRLWTSSFENVSLAWTQYLTLFVPVLILVRFVRRLVYKNNLLSTVIAEEKK